MGNKYVCSCCRKRVNYIPKFQEGECPYNEQHEFRRIENKNPLLRLEVERWLI